jgi:hypothetical protein
MLTLYISVATYLSYHFDPEKEGSSYLQNVVSIINAGCA